MTKVKEKTVMDRALAQEDTEKVAIDEMPLTSLREYRLYNEAARKANHRLKINRYPIKQCPIELHPSQRVVFQRNDQPTNPLLVHVSDHRIHYSETLIPGQSYNLPECIINHLSNKGYPIWGWVDNADGSRETKIVNTDPRFSLRTVYKEE